MKSTAKVPANSVFISSRMGAIILQGTHLSAPRSTSLGRPALATSDLRQPGAVPLAAAGLKVDGAGDGQHRSRR